MNWFIPALARSSPLSAGGINDELGTRRCPRSSKKRRNVSRIALPSIGIESLPTPSAEPGSRSRSPRRPGNGEPSAGEGGGDVGVDRHTLGLVAPRVGVRVDVTLGGGLAVGRLVHQAD